MIGPAHLPPLLREYFDLPTFEIEWRDLTPAEIVREEWRAFAQVRKRAFLREERRAESNTQKQALWKVESERLRKIWWIARHPGIQKTE
jgi:hypothetical protein